MASNFAFRPYGLSQSVTVGGAASATISLVAVAVGGTSTLALTGQNYLPPAVRISNDGTAACFINFGTSAATVSVSTTNGMKVRNGSDQVFMHSNQPFLAATCASTFTVTLSVTLGEGIS